MAEQTIHITDQEDSWYGLIEQMKEGKVIPVIGPELLEVTMPNADGTVVEAPFYRVVAEKLCAQYGVAYQELEARPGWDLHVASAAVIAETKENVEKVRRTAARIINTLAANASIAPALRVLAQIGAFDLFVCLTCDDFLANLIPDAHVATFSPRAATDSTVDIPPPRAGQRSIFRLLGGSANTTSFAIHEEDVLEYLFALQSGASRRLPVVLSEMRRRDLLFVGCSLPDWIGRNLLRLCSDDRLFTKSKQEFFSGHLNDPSLTTFISRFSPNTLIFDGDPKAFVDELSRRWLATRPEPANQNRTQLRISPLPAAAGPTAFLSYASENRDDVRRLADLLRAVGFGDIWLDQKKLVAGDDWSQRIDDAINICDFFIPVLSKDADARREGVYWEEWNKALDRSQRIPDEFIIPVCIDPAPAASSNYPRIARTRFSAFFERQLAHAPDGKLSDKALEDFRERVRRFNELK
jgi:hypothetical protein